MASEEAMRNAVERSVVAPLYMASRSRTDGTWCDGRTASFARRPRFFLCAVVGQVPFPAAVSADFRETGGMSDTRGCA